MKHVYLKARYGRHDDLMWLGNLFGLMAVVSYGDSVLFFEMEERVVGQVRPESPALLRFMNKAYTFNESVVVKECLLVIIPCSSNLSMRQQTVS